MNRSTRHHRPAPLTVALCASLSLHGLIMAPAVLVAIGSVNDNRAPSTVPPAPPPPETLIGIEESQATTVDWIGYAEFEEHLAELSETNQAALTQEPSPAAPAAEEEVVETDAETEVAAAEAAESDPTFEPEEEAPAESSNASPLPTEQELAAEQRPTEESGPPIPAIDLSDIIETARAWAMATIRAQQPTPASTNRLAAAGPTETAETAGPQASRSPSRSSNPSEPVVGDRSDKESDPSSTINVTKDQWVLGKPLAAHGGELFPKRMEVTTLTRITAWVNDAVVALVFDHRGVVISAKVLQSSGHSQVDKNMIDSLYGWRAVGGRFADLEQGQTITIQLRYILSK